MRSNYLKTLKTAVLAISVLLLGASVSFAQQTVSLTAGPASITLPDGSLVPMWGYTCGTTSAGATCAASNPNAAGKWSPVVIMTPSGQDLTIVLTNNLSFTGGPIPTSLVIVGQLGGGLGDVTQRTTTAQPDHSGAQSTATWPIAGANPDTGTPPAQGRRVQSFSTEVAFGGAPGNLTWKAPRPGTYLLESGTHPSIQGPMGLYGIVVVTSKVDTTTTPATQGTAYPGVKYDAEIPMLFSEIDPVQNNAVQLAVNTTNFSETAVWSGVSGACGDAKVHTCYPPAVNYTPLYYLINGVAFDKSNAGRSQFTSVPPFGVTPATGKVLVRMVNAGLRMHVPSIVGSQIGGAAGFSLIAEDGNPLPGVPRVQSEVFMAAGKTYDVMIDGPVTTATALPIYDRELSLSGNAIARDAGMLAYISIDGAGLPVPSTIAAVANPDTYVVVPGNTLTVSDPGKGVIANDVNVSGVAVSTAPTKGTLTLNSNGTFTYVPNAGWTAPDTFVYQANGTTGPIATVTLNAANIETGDHIHLVNDSYKSTVASAISIKPPGVLANDYDDAGYPLQAVIATAPAALGLTLNADGSFTANPTGAGAACVDPTVPAGSQCFTFTYSAKNSQGTASGSTATVTVSFFPASNLAVSVVDGKTKTAITDYRWIIEEDRTFYVDPNNTTNTGPAGSTTVPTFGVNFHTSYMPVVATGCTGKLSCESGQVVLDANGTPMNAVCDVGNGVCRQDTTGNGQTAVNPGKVYLDPNRRYYISVLPGDAANPFIAGNLSACVATTDKTYDPTQCGHGMGGAPIALGQKAVTILSEPTPLQTARLSVFVFEDDFPLNGENDAGGGVDTLSPNEPGLGGFNITLFDDAGGSGDATGQMTYDMFNMPLSNSLSGTIDPSTGFDACPVSRGALQTGPDSSKTASPTGITGTIVTCPEFESDGVTHSPLRGQAVVANLMPGRYGVVATPAADRIGRGEQWLQTNTLDGQKAHDSFLRVGEPSYFQEFGPAGYHVSIGFANPGIIQGRLNGVCRGRDPNITGTNCRNVLTGKVTTERMSRTPDERLFSSGSNDSFAFTQCYVSFGDPDGEDFAFAKCNADGTFTLTGLPDGEWRLTVFDQWNDMLVDGLSTPVGLSKGSSGAANHTTNLGDIAMNQWQANIYTRTFFDLNGDGISDNDANGNPEPGLALVATNIRFRDGSFSNFNNTDLNGYAGFNEVFPLFSWYVIETDSTRYKNTGTHVVYDAGGPADGTPYCDPQNGAPCGSSNIAANMANTSEAIPLPADLRVPGAVYCDNGDCTGFSIKNGPGSSKTGSTGRIDPSWVTSYGWQGFSGENSFLEFGKQRFQEGENGGIYGHVIYASTRPFDDPQLLLQTSWEPLVPGVTINLYQQSTAPDGTQTLKLVDTTKTSSWDDWAQGFRSDGRPNMNCPGQGTASGTNADLFFFSLFNQPSYLDVYNNTHNGTTLHTIPYNSQYKCYDGMHNWNQLQPAPYDGRYQFPSIVDRDPSTGAPTGTGSLNGAASPMVGTNCISCVANPTDGTPMLPAGKYVVEVVVPAGYELVKEEDKNILIGDNYIAPVTMQFAGLGDIFILPDQAAVGSTFNANNPQNPTQDLGRTTLPSHEGDTGSVEAFWPCVGTSRIVPQFISLFPGSQEVSPFAGAKRNLCDRKLVTLDDQTAALAKFYIFTSTHAAAHYTGVITDDFTSEFDPFSPQFGEKFAPPDLPISIKDFNGNEISRTYADHFGSYDGLNYSTWEVNPPNPTGYAPTMMITCMNDPGPIPGPNGTMVTDPLYNPSYSQFCYEIPFMPGQTQYMDTPVVPTSAFAGAGYNNPDCAYPDNTPAIASVTSSDIAGPWVSAAGSTHKLTITALGPQMVNNYGYSGPSATTANAPFNQKKVLRQYHFGGQAGSVYLVGSDGVKHNLTNVQWGDLQITGAVPAGLPACPIQQQAQFGGSTAQCGQLFIVTSTGQPSIDTVTVTVGGKKPTLMSANQTIQSQIDAASPGDMIIVPPGAYNEMVLMWKPVRLQGVGAASSVINANAHPAGKLDPWRRQVDCLFGVAMNGTPIGAKNPFDDPKDTANNGQPFTCPAAMNFAVDRLPLEAVVGWDATLNGNLAELLQEPTLMGAYEGAGITVLAKGVNFHGGDPWTDGTETGAFPTTATLLGNDTASCGRDGRNAIPNPYPSNFSCNPSSIDGLGITDSSQGGGGIFVHGWAHNLQIANNRVNSNTGTLSGGISIGQGEYPPQYLQNGTTPNTAPDSCYNSFRNSLFRNNPVSTNTQLPYCFNLNVNVHNNNVSLNNTLGDELFSGTPSGAGGVAFCTGADNYKFQNNWVCGNLSTGDGGGVIHLGFSYNGDIEHNSILFNQSTNPTIPTNGGGIAVLGAPDTDPVCGTAPDGDCPPGVSDGTGPNLTINANLIMGNAAESGSGGGIRFQGLNGTELTFFPDGRAQGNTPSRWYSAQVTNNIIANNVAGWDGAGISLQDALNVNIINNTIVSNDTTASSGVLFNTLGAPIASSQGPCPVNANPCVTTSTPQPSGLVAIQNSAVLTTALSGLTLNCPANHPNCATLSYPMLSNNLFWQNRAFNIQVGAFGGGTISQQHVVTLVPQLPNHGTSGQCMPVPDPTHNYWDIGVRGDTGPTTGQRGAISLNPVHSILTAMNGYDASNQSPASPGVVQQYCNGSRIPPEFGGMGYQVPPGISAATVPNPVFNLTPSATVDEGNNWINISWGPLAMTNPKTNAVLGNYGLAAGSPAIDMADSSVSPGTDYFGNPRPSGAEPDIGAVELTEANAADLDMSPSALSFGTIGVNTASASQFVTLTSAGTSTLNGTNVVVSAPFKRVAGTGGCGTGGVGTVFNVTAGQSCRIYVTYNPTSVGASAGTITVTSNDQSLDHSADSVVTLSGSAVRLSVSPASLSFLTFIGGNFGNPQPVTVRNTATAGGTGPITVSITGATNGVVFQVSSNNCPAGGLAPGASCTIGVRFRSPTAGTQGTATLNITDTEPATETVSLSGTRFF
jgi:hypothetical protein